MRGYDYGYSMMGYGFGLLHMVFWFVVLVIGIGALIRLSRGKPIWRCHGHCGGGTALDILKERYAKGEIDKKEFDEKQRDLAA